MKEQGRAGWATNAEPCSNFMMTSNSHYPVVISATARILHAVLTGCSLEVSTRKHACPQQAPKELHEIIHRVSRP